MSSEYDVDPKIELRKYTAELKKLRLNPKRNAVRINLAESAVYHLRKRIAELDRTIYVKTEAGYCLIAHADPNPNRLPEIQLGCKSIDGIECRAYPNDLMRLLRKLGKSLPDDPDYNPWSFTTPRWEWTRQQHGQALDKLRDHIKANRMGEALLSVWNLAVGYSRLSAQASVKEGARKLKWSIRNKSSESGKTSRGTRQTRDSVRTDVEARLLNGEEWDAVVNDILSRPYPSHPVTGKTQFKTGRDSGPQEWPTKNTFTKRWLNGLNPNKPGPRKQKGRRPRG